MQVINLTDHAVIIVNAKNEPIKVFPASGKVAHCEHTLIEQKRIGGVPIHSKSYGPVKGLPLPDDNMEKIYIVNEQVAEAVRDSRFDVVIPEGVVHTVDGNFYKQLIAV